MLEAIAAFLPLLLIERGYSDTCRYTIPVGIAILLLACFLQDVIIQAIFFWNCDSTDSPKGNRQWNCIFDGGRNDCDRTADDSICDSVFHPIGFIPSLCVMYNHESNCGFRFTIS